MCRDFSSILLSRLLSLCQARGISVNKLAGMSGLSQTTLNSFIHGQSKNPTVRTLHKMANGFGMTLAEFLDFPELNRFSFDDDREDP